MIVLETAVAALIGYLLGAIPVGLLLCRLRGIDPREHGSGRTGGTNVYRATRSPTLALLTATGDVVKGLLPVLLIEVLFPNQPIVLAVAGIAAIAGHNWSVYIRFGGGAGTMTNFGAMLGLSPLTALVMAAVGVMSFWVSRMASVASLSVAWGALVMLIVMALLVPHPGLFLARVTPISLILYGIGEASLITWALRPNIQRLIRGEERRVEY